MLPQEVYHPAIEISMCIGASHAFVNSVPKNESPHYNLRKANFKLFYDCILHEDWARLSSRDVDAAYDILYFSLNNAFEELVRKYSIFFSYISLFSYRVFYSQDIMIRLSCIMF